MASDFLESLQECAVSEIFSLIDENVVEVLDSSPDEPFQGENANEQFLDFTESIYFMKYRIREARRVLKSSVMEPRQEGFKLDVEKHRKLISVLLQIHDRARSIVEGKLAATEAKLGAIGLPRVVRLARKYNFSKAETRVVEFCVVSSLKACRANKERHMTWGKTLPNTMDHLANDVQSVCQACDISLTALLKFLSPDHEHMKRNLFYNFQTTSLQAELDCDEIGCMAMAGCKLSSSDFLHLDQTCWGDIIAEEPEAKKYYQSAKAFTDEESSTEIKEADADIDLDAVLNTERIKEEELKKQINARADAEIVENKEKTSEESLQPYKTDLEYLEHHIQFVTQKLKLNCLEGSSRYHYGFYRDEDVQNTDLAREKRVLEAKAKVLEGECRKRLELTKQAGIWMPRLERLVVSRRLSSFEKNILLTLIGNAILPNKIVKFLERDEMTNQPKGLSVGELLRVFYTDLKSQIAHRKYFYKSAPMVREGMIIVHSSGLSTDPALAGVEVDRRMLDFCVGLDTEFSEIVEGSHLYFPKTKTESVILSKDKKELILQTVRNYEAYKICKKKLGLDDAIAYGSGMVILFYGPSGTGKTMMANALANSVGKRILLINFPSLGSMCAGENFKFVFREAKINDAILFFDECEAIFESRDLGGKKINMLLTEIERHDGLIILATNRPYDMDEAMHRRVMLAVEFRRPDHLLRKAIWDSHVPENLPLAEDVNTNELAIRYELTGGFIKNAILSALSIAVSRDGENPVLRHADLLMGANLQLRGHLRLKDFDRRVVPSCGLDEVIVDEKLMKILRNIVSYEKARSVMFGQWGFGKKMSQGITALFYGPPGTGKSLAAEAVGYEVGRPLKVINCGELLSNWIGESARNIESIFEEGKNSDAILVLDEAEGLFGATASMTSSIDLYGRIDVGVLLYHIERYSGIVILITNMIDSIDKAIFRRLKFILRFTKPSKLLKEKLWKTLIPSETPLAEDVDFERLAELPMVGGDIKGAIFRAASVAALRLESERSITMEDLKNAADDEINKTAGQLAFAEQDSQAEASD